MTVCVLLIGSVDLYCECKLKAKTLTPLYDEDLAPADCGHLRTFTFIAIPPDP